MRSSHIPNSSSSSSVQKKATPSVASVTPIINETPSIQSKSCACGGSCPRCSGTAQLKSKLPVSKPNDPAEQQADQISERVMQSSSGIGAINQSQSASIHRKPATAKKESTKSADPAIPEEVGEPLEEETRSFMESRFGEDFSGVRIHTGSKAEQSSNSLNANAYTIGNDIVFGERQYAPNTSSGKKLLAHELTHVVQQNSSGNNVIARDDKKGAAATTPTPASMPTSDPDPIPDRGQMFVNRTPDGLWYYTFNSADYPDWSSNLQRLVTIHINTTFSGVTDAVIRDFLAANFTLNLTNPPNADDNPGNVEYAVILSVEMSLHSQIVSWMASHYPQVQEKRAATGTQNLPAGSSKKEGTSQDKEKPKTDPAAPTTDRYISPMQSNLSVMAGNRQLSLIYLMMMEHFSSLPFNDANRALASDGLTAEELESLIGTDSLRRTLTDFFTQGWTEFTQAGGNSPDAFGSLIERILEQFTRGNPNATANRLRIGHGDPERQILGIVHRNNGILLYDDLGLPLKWTYSARDTGLVSVAISESATREGMKSKKPPMTRREESDKMTTNLFLGALGVNDAAMVEQAAVITMQHIETVAARIRDGLPGDIAEALGKTILVLSGFMVGHAFTAFAMRSSNPYLFAVGALVELLLRAAGYALGISFVADIAETLVEAGFHMSRVRDDDKGKPTALSEYHMNMAAEPIRKLIIDTAVVMGGVAFAKAVRSSTVKNAALKWGRVAGMGLMLGVAEAVPATRGTGGGANGVGVAEIMGDRSAVVGKTPPLVFETTPPASQKAPPVTETAPSPVSEKAPAPASEKSPAATPVKAPAAPVAGAAAPATTTATAPTVAHAPLTTVEMAKLGIPAEQVQVLDAANFSDVDLKADQNALYILLDAAGNILKVGKTSEAGAVGRFAVYKRAGAARLEVYPLEPTAKTAETFEKILRDKMEADGHEMPWDNTNQRLGRPGFGTPGEGVRTPPVTKARLIELLAEHKGNRKAVGVALAKELGRNSVHPRTVGMWAQAYGLDTTVYK